MDNKLYWIWLQLALGPATATPKKLINHFENDISAIYEADYDEYKAIDLTPKQIKTLIEKNTDEAQRIVDWCDMNKVGILCYDDEEFPERLRSIPDSPIVLYYIGELYSIDTMLCLAGVGTRSATKYGCDTAYSFCYELARCGAIVVSGLASGIDTHCHRAALDSGGRTIAVLGCRINKVYPLENRDIMREIARKGLLLTEYHPFFKTQAMNFPQRNRIISGLCQGTIVFEADVGSGSLITADLAVRQGRNVYALPGRIGEHGSTGTNNLIRAGATPIIRPEEVLDEYRFLYELGGQRLWIPEYSEAREKYDNFLRRSRSKEKTQGNKNNSKKEEKQQDVEIPDELSDELQRLIYAKLSTITPISVEELSIDGYDLGDIMSAITVLELIGLVIHHPGNTFTRLY